MKKSLFLALALIVSGCASFFHAHADTTNERPVFIKKSSCSKPDLKKIAMHVLGIPVALYASYRLLISDWFIPGFSSFGLDFFEYLSFKMKINFLRSIGCVPVVVIND